MTQINTPLVIDGRAIIDFHSGTGVFTVTIDDVLVATFTTGAALALGLTTIADHEVTAVVDLDTSDTYADADVNGMKDDIMTEVSALATALNAILARLEAAGISAAA
jgi:hypothetical protein